MAVQRHRLDTERLAEAAHAERLDSACVAELDGAAQRAFAAQRRAALGRWAADPATLFNVSLIRRPAIASEAVDAQEARVTRDGTSGTLDVAAAERTLNVAAAASLKVQ